MTKNKYMLFLEKRYAHNIFDVTRIAKTRRFLLRQKGIAWSPFKMGYFCAMILEQEKKK